MSIEAAAEALAPEAIEAPQIPEVETEDDALNRIWEENNTDEAPETEDAAPVEAEQPVEEPEKVEDAPSSLPRALRESWANIPAEARTAFQEAHQELTTKLGEQGRLVQGIKPIQDALVNAIDTLPALKGMKPEDVARDVLRLAEYEQNFAEKPVETIMSLIKARGLEQQVAQAFSGQTPTNEGKVIQGLQTQVQNLQKHIEKITDPGYLRDQVTQITSHSQTESEVTKFASTAEHWDAVEAHMPAAIQFVQAKLGEGTAPQAVLSEAYELAISQFVPEAKAKPEAAVEAAPSVDPEKTQAQLKAKSVNVQSKASGKIRELTEDEMLDKVWRKHNS